MAVMQFLTQNNINTTTMAIVNSNTTTVSNLFDRGTTMAYSSSGLNVDGTSSVISVVFAAATNIDTIFIQNHNLKSFRIYYNSTTANSLYVTTTNSATSTYITFATVSVNSIDIQMTDTIQANSEKSVGELYLGSLLANFERNPSIDNYSPKLFRKNIKHEMPDGGVVMYNVNKKFKADLSWQFVSSTFRDTLFNIVDSNRPVYFLPFPTVTAWDSKAYECLITNDFDFNFSDNVSSAGWGGSLTLEETPGV